MLFSLGLGTGKTPEPEVGRPEVVMVRVRNVAEDRNNDSRVLKLEKCHDGLPTTETGSSATDDVSSVILGNLVQNIHIYATQVVPTGGVWRQHGRSSPLLPHLVLASPGA